MTHVNENQQQAQISSASTSSSTPNSASPDERSDSLLTQPVTRRDMLRMAGVGGLGLLLGAGGVAGWVSGGRNDRKATVGDPATPAASSVSKENLLPFYGQHQQGIVNPAQDFVCFAAFDLTARTITQVRELFQAWSAASARMAAGEPVGDIHDDPNLPPSDTGEAAGLSPSRLTITFGVGPSLFDSRYGLAGKRPSVLADLPSFNGDALEKEWSGGDIGVQVCADDLQVAFHAIRNLTRIARGKAVLRWTQEGFQRTRQADPEHGTPRNLLGFKDGTGNPDTSDDSLMQQVVWTQAEDGTSWMQNGSYMVVRRIRMRVEVWDRTALGEQEQTFGRHRDTGAPLGSSKEFDPVDLEKKDASGKPVIPEHSHVRLAMGDGSVKILRRSYSYSSGIDRKTGQLDAGLLFISYQRDPVKQFIPMQQRLAKGDKLNEYIQPVGSAIFACFPGTRAGGFIGDTLFTS